MLDVTGSRELQATIYALRQARRDVRTGINRDARNTIRPLWQREVAARARTNMDRRVIVQGARATPSDRGFRLMAATSNRPLRGGLVPSEAWQGNEFGASPSLVRVRQRSRRGRVYQRRMMINRQFRARTKDGQIAMDAASTTGRRLVATWVRTVVDGFAAVPAVEVTA